MELNNSFSSDNSDLIPDINKVQKRTIRKPRKKLIISDVMAKILG